MADLLTNEQVEEFNVAFASFDKDFDGKLNSKEVIMAMKALGVNVPESEIQAPSLDFPGFLALVARKLQILDPEEEIKRAVLCFDQDGSGFVTNENLRYILTSIGDALSAQEADAMIRECDADNDGRVSAQDVAKVLLKYA